MYMHTAHHHASPALPNICHSLTCDMWCSLDSLIGDCLPNIALLAWLIVLAVEVNFFAKRLSPLDVPHLHARSRTQYSQKPAFKAYNNAEGLAPLNLPVLHQLKKQKHL